LTYDEQSRYTLFTRHACCALQTCVALVAPGGPRDSLYPRMALVATARTRRSLWTGGTGDACDSTPTGKADPVSDVSDIPVDGRFRRSPLEFRVDIHRGRQREVVVGGRLRYDRIRGVLGSVDFGRLALVPKDGRREMDDVPRRGRRYAGDDVPVEHTWQRVSRGDVDSRHVHDVADIDVLCSLPRRVSLVVVDGIDEGPLARVACGRVGLDVKASVYDSCHRLSEHENDDSGRRLITQIRHEIVRVASSLVRRQCARDGRQMVGILSHRQHRYE